MHDLDGARMSVVGSTQDFWNQGVMYAQVWGPRLLAAAVILLIGWLIARAVKWGVAAVINRTPVARHANQPNLPERHPSTVGAQVGNAAYWIVLLVAFLLAAQPLGLATATGPLGNMVQQFGQAVPHIFGAALILFIGYVLAQVARKATEAVITASHVQTLSARVGADMPSDPSMLPRTIGSIVFALVIIPVAIAALDTLNIAAISQPATAMLRIILDAIPHVIAAGIILALAYAIGRFASKLLTQFLATTGFDHTIGSLGLFAQSDRSATERTSTTTPAIAPAIVPSQAVGTAAFVAILIFGMMEAFRQLNFAYGSRIMAEVLTLFGQVVFGAIIIAVSVIIARLVARTIEASGGETPTLAGSLTRVAIIVLGVAVGLRFMGLADDIINLAFGLILGAIAVAFALAFGIGGREPAKRAVERLLGQISADNTSPTEPAARPTMTPIAPEPSRSVD